MKYWSELIINGVNIDLGHLEPFEFVCTARDIEGAITISVRFNDHCFTKDFNPVLHGRTNIISRKFSNKNELRVFCEERYLLSHKLPEIIMSLHNKRIASSREGNLVRIEAPNGQTYAVFFTLRKQNTRRINLFVVSAYPVASGKRVVDTGEMKFDKALAKIIRGEKPKFPSR
jgi:hypothetical protein